eukprot:1493885-Rhodomonas_salina.2
MDMTNLKGVYAEAMQERNRQEGRNSRMDEKRAKTAERQNGGRDSRMKTEKLRMPTMNTGHGGPDPVRREKLRVALIAKLMSKYHPGKPACPRGTCAEPGPDLVSGAARNSTIQDRENGELRLPLLAHTQPDAIAALLPPAAESVRAGLARNRGESAQGFERGGCVSRYKPLQARNSLQKRGQGRVGADERHGGQGACLTSVWLGFDQGLTR